MSSIKVRPPLLAFFVIGVVGVGFAIGLTIRPGAWYESLEKPFFTPPNWVFGPVWTVVYVLIAIAGWRVALSEGFSSAAFRLWGLQMVLNWAWTPIFFGAHSISLGLVTILSLSTVAIFLWPRLVTGGRSGVSHRILSGCAMLPH